MTELEVIKNACKTCIYRKDSPLDLDKLEAQIRDVKMDGFFAGHRVCHNHDRAVCRGFWNRHKNAFTLGQMAQRLGLVKEIENGAR